jgi:hypothetical protein
MYNQRAVGAAAAFLLVGLTGCPKGDVGRPCVPASGNPIDPNFRQTLVSSPALECQSRLCLVQTYGPNIGPSATCTEQCTSDAQCQSDTETTAQCPSGFVCAVATLEGSFKCRSLCVCRSDLECGLNGDADGGVITPASCPGASLPPAC